MNIARFLLLSLLGWAATVAFAKAPARHPTVTREVAFSGCHFSMRDAYRGSLKLATDGGPSIANYHGEISLGARHPFDTWIQFYCPKDGTEKA